MLPSVSANESEEVIVRRLSRRLERFLETIEKDQVLPADQKPKDEGERPTARFVMGNLPSIEPEPNPTAVSQVPIPAGMDSVSSVVPPPLVLPVLPQVPLSVPPPVPKVIPKPPASPKKPQTPPLPNTQIRQFMSAEKDEVGLSADPLYKTVSELPKTRSKSVKSVAFFVSFLLVITLLGLLTYYLLYAPEFKV